MLGYQLQFAGSSDQGLVRAANQDAYFVDEPEGRFFLVADGMGGHAGGEEASRIAAQSISRYLSEHWDCQTPDRLLKEALLQANQEIIQSQQSEPAWTDMGTTIVVVIFPQNDQPWCAHIGDSRLYRWRPTQLEQITEDHTWIADAVKSGVLTPEQGRAHPWRHVLSQCLGREEVSDIAIQPLTIQGGDRLLLCSDGLTEELTDGQIVTYLEPSSSCQDAAIELIEAAKQEGGQDNITVVIVAIDGPEIGLTDRPRGERTGTSKSDTDEDTGKLPENTWEIKLSGTLDSLS